MADRLLRHPVPYTNESIGNYVLRLCSENSCRVNQIAELIGFFLRGIDNFYGELKEKHIVRFSEVTGIDTKVIEDMTAKRFNFGYRNDYTSHTKAGVCPKCYSEESYERIHWKNELIKVCIDHEIYLVDECPRCKEKITINKLFYGKCECGLLISDIKSTKCDNEYVLKNQNILYQIFNIKSRVSLNESNMLFNTLSSMDYCNLLYHLQNIASQYADDLNNLETFLENDGGLNSSIIASQIMFDWPTGLINFLNILNCLDVNYIISTPSIKVSYEWLYELAYREEMVDRYMRIFNPLECLKLRSIYNIVYNYKEIYQPIMKYYFENNNKEKVKTKMNKYIYQNDYIELHVAIKIFFSIDGSDFRVKDFVRDYFQVVKFFDKEYINLEEILSFYDDIYTSCSLKFSDIKEIRSSYTCVTEQEKSDIYDAFEKKLAYDNLLKIISLDLNPLLFEKLKLDIDENNNFFQEWWSINIAKYNWKTSINGFLTINFETNEIILNDET